MLIVSTDSSIFTLFYPDPCLTEQPPLLSSIVSRQGRTWKQTGRRDKMTLGFLPLRLPPCKVAAVTAQAPPGGYLHNNCNHPTVPWVPKFKLRCWRRLLRVPWTAGRFNQSILQEIIGRTDAEIPILWPPDAKNWLIGKDPDAGKDWRQEKKGMTVWTWVWTNSRR